ncbi:DUF2782 domain-containing protein [Pseudoxanthomonas composti]|uniref:DUF2782 domain-containing protein n=1 Tax=Pseudoxanthomonas composti TaxID=2137479 RepID=A0A4Q1JYJ0_9GAMM|nr:DUF2782 domain-containing protein [Pseudoxanthomonas composti]RXR06494.1 DUF2782 domain-containing protein [Pseudoxanthomonas composti]
MKTMLAVVAALALAGCASAPRQFADMPEDVDLTGAEQAVRVEANGDVVEEYRVAGQLRMVKVTPSSGPAYYLIDDNGHSRLRGNRANGEPAPVQWQLYSW